MTNFDYLKDEKDFDSFVDIAVVAEKTFDMMLAHVFLTADERWKRQLNGCIPLIEN